MKLGKDFPENWKEKSKESNIPLSDLLYGYALEDFISRIEKSNFYKFLWITNEEALGESAYKRKNKTSLEYIYVKNEEIDVLLKDIFDDYATDVQWTYEKRESENGVQLFLTCTHMGMEVPVLVEIRKASLSSQKAKEKEATKILELRKKYKYFSYSKEAILAEALFEIMRKLELISDMEAYDVVNEIIKTQPVSGRHVLEDFKAMGEREPKVVAKKRLEQLESYKDYGYMKKKWQQYARNRKEEADDWQELMERLINFTGPLWNALCENAIFFDDWMPELGRFLG